MIKILRKDMMEGPILTLLKVFRSRMHEFQSHKLEASLLKTGDDGSNESTLDAVGLRAHVHA